MSCDFCCEKITSYVQIGLWHCRHVFCGSCMAQCGTASCPFCSQNEQSCEIELESSRSGGYPSAPAQCILDTPIDEDIQKRMLETVTILIPETVQKQVDKTDPKKIEKTETKQWKIPLQVQNQNNASFADGFSFYRCVAKAIWNSDSHYKTLWYEVVGQICLGWNYYSVYTTDSEGNTFDSAQDYAVKSEAFKSWRDRMTEIQVTCDIFALKIVIVSTSDRGTKEIGFCSKNGNIYKTIRLKDCHERDVTLEPLELSALVAVPELHKVRITGDGNCLYRAISMAITSKEKFHKIVRKLIVTYVRTNWEKLSPFAFDRSGHTYKSVGSYAMHNSSSGDFGGSLEIYAASKALNVVIVLHSEPDTIHFHVESPDYSEPIHLLHQGSKHGGHFDLLLRPGSTFVPSESILRRACNLHTKTSQKPNGRAADSTKRRAVSGPSAAPPVGNARHSQHAGSCPDTHPEVPRNPSKASATHSGAEQPETNHYTLRSETRRAQNVRMSECPSQAVRVHNPANREQACKDVDAPSETVLKKRNFGCKKKY